jgi:Cu/Ag efflux protein CusF
MNRSIKFGIFLHLLSAALFVAFASSLVAQAPPVSRFLGTVTAINGTALTVKTDAGESHQVDVPTTAILKQIAPGEKDLSKAEVIEFSSLAAGDRVLVRLDLKAPEGASVALQIIAIKQADLAKKQDADRIDWQRRGVGGLVKSVDPATSTILITSGAGSTAKTITIHTTPASVLKRYAPASVSFNEAKAAPFAEIKPGDQIRARGNKSTDGNELTAEETVSGSFRNIAGQVVSVDAASSTLVVKDLTTKKPTTIKFTSESQLKKLPDMMATRLAMFLKGDAAGAGARRPGASAGGATSAAGAAPMQAGGNQRSGFGGGAFDPQMMLSRAPVIQLTDLKKGDAVMLVATQADNNDLTAVTLLAGVEPILEAPAASNLLSNWSMSSGSAEMGQ